MFLACLGLFIFTEKIDSYACIKLCTPMKTVGHVVVVGPSAGGSEQLLVLCWLRSL